MMLYQSGRGIDPGKMYVRLNPGNNGEFAVIELTDDGAALFIKDAADADALIAAACEAKKLLEPPVITDSDRTCDQANPGTGAWCHRGGDHGVHEDTDGQTWRTDGLRCECSHGQDEHDDADDSDAGRAPHECLRPGCGCTVFRPAAPRPHAEPPAVVNDDVVLEVRALLP